MQADAPLWVVRSMFPKYESDFELLQNGAGFRPENKTNFRRRSVDMNIRGADETIAYESCEDVATSSTRVYRQLSRHLLPGNRQVSTAVSRSESTGSRLEGLWWGRQYDHTGRLFSRQLISHRRLTDDTGLSFISWAACQFNCRNGQVPISVMMQCRYEKSTLRISIAEQYCPEPASDWDDHVCFTVEASICTDVAYRDSPMAISSHLGPMGRLVGWQKSSRQDGMQAPSQSSPSSVEFYEKGAQTGCGNWVRVEATRNDSPDTDRKVVLQWSATLPSGDTTMVSMSWNFLKTSSNGEPCFSLSTNYTPEGAFHVNTTGLYSTTLLQQVGACTQFWRWTLEDQSKDASAEMNELSQLWTRNGDAIGPTGWSSSVELVKESPKVKLVRDRPKMVPYPDDRLARAKAKAESEKQRSFMGGVTNRMKNLGFGHRGDGVGPAGSNGGLRGQDTPGRPYQTVQPAHGKHAWPTIDPSLNLVEVSQIAGLSTADQKPASDLIRGGTRAPHVVFVVNHGVAHVHSTGRPSSTASTQFPATITNSAVSNNQIGRVDGGFGVGNHKTGGNNITEQPADGSLLGRVA